MRTIDEVIKAIDFCNSGDSSKCKDCPYIGTCELNYAVLFDDALHYLKEYQTRKLNNPLTKEELQKYKHKPVWIKWINNIWNGTCKWVLIADINDNEIIFSALDVAGQHYYGHLMFININKEWEAYEKEND